MSKNSADERRLSQQGTGAAPRSICDDTWVTRVGVITNPTELVDINVDAASGKITGNYFTLDATTGKPVLGDPIFGQCTEGPPHRIQYERRDSTGAVIRTYDGRIFVVDLGLTATPVITLIIGTTNVPKAADGDDDWMGGHTT